MPHKSVAVKVRVMVCELVHVVVSHAAVAVESDDVTVTAVHEVAVALSVGREPVQVTVVEAGTEVKVMVLVSTTVMV